MSAKHVGWTLPAWIGVACVLFWFAPDPPPNPGPTEQEAAAEARATALVVRDAQEWQEHSGDLAPPWSGASGHLAIVVDDVGRELHVLDQLLSLRFRLTFAVLPGSVYATGAQLRLQADRRRYREILLHLPMEPLDPAQMLAPGESDETFLLASDNRATLLEKLDAAFSAVPTAVGVNNHMGSRLTADPEAMAAVMMDLEARGLLFLDSRTTPDTVAEAVALRRGVLAGSRQVFLDNEVDAEAIGRQLALAAKESREAPVVAIGHPSVELYEVLAEKLPALHAAGIGVYPLSDVLRHAAALETE